jgi:NAD(P)-dependent dehydrogenase (short-subunit alcohol dehydrogenase family)
MGGIYQMNIKGWIAIVTGGASGIGRQTSLRLAREGAKVAIVDLNLDGANKVGEEIKALGGEAIALKVDITSLDEAHKMAQAALDRFGQVDILANIAGGAFPSKMGSFAQSNRAMWDLNINLNLFGTFNCTRAIVNHMIERKKGKIVNIASVAGIVGQATTADYAAAKGGIIAFTKSMAKELAPYGINVNCVSPAITGTERVRSMPKDFLQKQIDTIHLHRFGEPEEIANVVVFLASDEASFVTGANYVADGGITLSY